MLLLGNRLKTEALYCKLLVPISDDAPFPVQVLTNPSANFGATDCRGKTLTVALPVGFNRSFQLLGVTVGFHAIVENVCQPLVDRREFASDQAFHQLVFCSNKTVVTEVELRTCFLQHAYDLGWWLHAALPFFLIFRFQCPAHTLQSPALPVIQQMDFLQLTHPKIHIVIKPLVGGRVTHIPDCAFNASGCGTDLALDFCNSPGLSRQLAVEIGKAHQGGEVGFEHECEKNTQRCDGQDIAPER